MSDFVSILKQLPALRSPAARQLFLQARQRAFNTNVANLMSQLRSESIALVDWTNAMKHEIKTLHTTSAAIGKGDWRAMTQSDWGRVGRQVRTQYDYLRGMVDDLKLSDGQPLSGRFDVRAKMYGGAGRGEFSRAELTEMLDQGKTEYKWTLTPAEHCLDCIAYADQGWVVVGTFEPAHPGSGHTACLTNCKCFLEYRGGPEE